VSSESFVGLEDVVDTKKAVNRLLKNLDPDELTLNPSLGKRGTSTICTIFSPSLPKRRGRGMSSLISMEYFNRPLAMGRRKTCQTGGVESVQEFTKGTLRKSSPKRYQSNNPK